MVDAPEAPGNMRVLVLGGYGFIGAEIVRTCLAEGLLVRALGRNGARRGGGAEWITGDLATMQTPGDWTTPLNGIDVVVNAAGSLQDGLRDRVDLVQHRAMAALGEAAALAGVQVVQISATGADETADTAFLRTKAVGDQALLDSGAEVVILRPGLVLGRGVYGGTALLRMLAAVPWVQPMALAEAPVQVISMDDLTGAVLCAVRGRITTGRAYDLVSEQTVTLGALTGEIRAWLGFAPARLMVSVPGWAARLTGRLADGLGWLGWRSPLRSTALRVLETGVIGDPGPWRTQTGATPSPLATIVHAAPAVLQDRWHARLYLLMPLIVAGLAGFWIASGLIGAVEWRAAVTLLGFAGFSIAEAKVFVFGGALCDIALGLAVLVRPTARRACLGMIGLSIGYLGASAWFTPWLWADPLGPMVKVIPGILLAAVLHAILEER